MTEIQNSLNRLHRHPPAFDCPPGDRGKVILTQPVFGDLQRFAYPADCEDPALAELQAITAQIAWVARIDRWLGPG